MRFVKNVLTLSVAALAAAAMDARAASAPQEDYVRAPMPPGFQVIINELEGPVFADAQGRTFYKWPKKALRNGDAGEIQFKPTCGNEPYRESSGLMSPYPAGLEMPEVDTRPGCTQVWPPALAAADAKPVGKWTIVDRLDGRKQWAYDGWSLYTSVLDTRPGDANGGSAVGQRFDGGATRQPVGPDANVPSQFIVKTTPAGRLVTLNNGWSVYTHAGDGKNKSNCRDACIDGFEPVLAASYARSMGEWTSFERAPGVYQWAFRGKPLYRYLSDAKKNAQDGSDYPGWSNVYTQRIPTPPKGFVIKDTPMGVMLGDDRGMTVYQYLCVDDAIDQLACDNPDAPQVHRFTVCGGGDPDTCVKAFPYVLAPAGAKSGSQIWTAMYIDPKTGKRAKQGDAGALNVWAFRGRPVYTFAGRDGYGDETPDDFKAHNWGEFTGWRNGYQVIVYRDLFENRED